MKTKTVHEKLGMRRSYFFPITAEPAGSHPSYGPGLDMGEAVLGHLSTTYATGDIYGDDRAQLHAELFLGFRLDAETTCDELELSAEVYGRKYADGMETSNMDDAPPYGGYAYIEPFIKADKSLVFRSVFLYKLTAMPSEEKDDADTRKGDFNPQSNAVSYSGCADSTGDWRDRKEFGSEAEAEAWIFAKAGAVEAYVVKTASTGLGSVTPEGITTVAKGGSLTLSFDVAPTAVFDNSADVTASVADQKYTIGSIDKNHDVMVVFAV